MIPLKFLHSKRPYQLTSPSISQQTSTVGPSLLQQILHFLLHQSYCIRPFFRDLSNATTQLIMFTNATVQK